MARRRVCRRSPSSSTPRRAECRRRNAGQGRQACRPTCIAQPAAPLARRRRRRPRRAVGRRHRSADRPRWCRPRWRTAARARGGGSAGRTAHRRRGMSVGLHLSAFAWPGGRQRLADHLGRIVADAEAAGVEHVWLMDHLRQIPQVGRPWDDLPDPYGVLAWIAARTERVRPRRARDAGVPATGGGAGQGRRHPRRAVGGPCRLRARRRVVRPGVRRGRDRVPVDRRSLRRPRRRPRRPARSGARDRRSFDGRSGLTLPEALSYPRPVQERSPRSSSAAVAAGRCGLAARHADACNVFGDPDAVAERVAILRRHCDDVGRDPAVVTRHPPVDGAARPRPGRRRPPWWIDCARPAAAPSVTPPTSTPARSTTTSVGPPAWPPPGCSR